MKFLFGGKGRVSRKAIWLFMIAYFALYFGLFLLDSALGWVDETGETGALSSIFGLLAVWPSIAISAKRFHDRGMTGWWVLWFVVLTIVPVVGFVATNLDGMANVDPETLAGLHINAIGWAMIGAAIIVQLVQFVILMVLPGDKGENRYGPDPRAS